jgi:hypothetical protein
MRFAACLFGACLYLLFMLLRLHAPHTYEALLRATDAIPNAKPFGDLGSILQAGACWRAGVNVYGPSACMHGGVYNYSPFLLRAAYFHIGPQDLDAGGLLLGGVFIAAFSLLPAPRSRAELMLRVMAMGSGTVIYALESANFDVVVFLLTLLGILLLLANRWAALAGYAVFLLAAACKFYPAALLALVVRERRAVVLGAALLVAVAGGLYLLMFASGTEAAISILPAGLPFRGVFGSLNLVFGLELLRNLPVLTLEPDVPQYFAAVDRPHVEMSIELATRCLTVLAIFCAALLAPRYTAALRGLDARRGLFFMAGAMVIVFCFFAAQNLDYRGVFLLFTLPGLWAMAGAASGSLRRGLAVLLGFIMVLLWEGFFRNFAASLGMLLLGPERAVYPEIAFWLVRECLWWWVAVQLAAFIVCFLRTALAGLRPQMLDGAKSNAFSAAGRV